MALAIVVGGAREKTPPNHGPQYQFSYITGLSQTIAINTNRQAIIIAMK